jgi:hypothetical protein
MTSFNTTTLFGLLAAIGSLGASVDMPRGGTKSISYEGKERCTPYTQKYKFGNSAEQDHEEFPDEAMPYNWNVKVNDWNQHCKQVGKAKTGDSTWVTATCVSKTWMGTDDIKLVGGSELDCDKMTIEKTVAKSVSTYKEVTHSASVSVEAAYGFSSVSAGYSFSTTNAETREAQSSVSRSCGTGDQTKKVCIGAAPVKAYVQLNSYYCQIYDHQIAGDGERLYDLRLEDCRTTRDPDNAEYSAQIVDWTVQWTDDEELCTGGYGKMDPKYISLVDTV